MKVLIFGASGIIGQHMRLSVPDGVTPVWYRQTEDPITHGVELCDEAARTAVLDEHRPDVVMNLAGESRPDVVEQNRSRYTEINALVPLMLSQWCDLNHAWLIHLSTQAVFSGQEPPYDPSSLCAPVNAYGHQKLLAEQLLADNGRRLTTIRPTVVLGVRPLPHAGRPNPVELMLSGQRQQVNDRWFSPLSARDAARLLWDVARAPHTFLRKIHMGLPQRLSRYDIACALGLASEPVAHEFFPGIAPRPLDTTYGTTLWLTQLQECLVECRRDWESRLNMDVRERAREIALFLGIREDQAYAGLSRGFAALHGDVAADFRRANPKTDDELLDWYRRTESYLWELSAYHADPGFNYKGLCQGIEGRLKAAGVKRVLCLGDGIGDLTLSLYQSRFESVYHDLSGSRTADFARFRFWKWTGKEMPVHLTSDWAPELMNARPYDAVISLDFLEHVTDVPAWTRAIRESLTPGGFFFAQNAFAIGSGENGSIPCHLERNDRYAQEWRPLLESLAFQDDQGNWWRRGA